MLPLLHGHDPWAGVALGATKFWRSPEPALQTFLDALIEPSLQTNFPEAQCETPPFLPLHGVFPALTVVARHISVSIAAHMCAARLFMIFSG